MRRIIVLLALLAAGVGAWQIGNRLSTDSIGMAVGLVFGVLAGVPSALLVLATGRRQRDDDDDSGAYEDGYRHGMRDTTSLAMGTRPQPIDDGRFSAEWMNAMMAQRNAPSAVVTVERPVRYTTARPFDIVVRPPDPPQLLQCGICKTIYTGDECPVCGVDDFECPITQEEARQALTAHWQRCPDCGLPLTPDEHCADWCGAPASGRRFVVTGELATYDGGAQ